ncbi:MAG: helix-turn-helix transcriptional regulator [Mucilaginibacter sp.]|nr:helix-turn-helix transcriptional regulator [Mucilaginibacter sp.]
MNKLLALREEAHLTQEELAEKSGISVRTIQRLEAGQAPKGYTLKALAKALAVDDRIFSASAGLPRADHLKWCKIMNLCALPLMLLPPLNVLIPLGIYFFKTRDAKLGKTIVSLQIIWTLIAIFLLLVVLMLNDWLGLSSRFTLLIPVFWLLINTLMIVRNAVELGGSGNPRILPDLSVF